MPKENYPDWFTAAAAPELRQIKGRYSGKKRATILAIAAQRVLGLPVDWSRPDLYNRTHWYNVRDQYAAVQTAVDDALLDAKDAAAVAVVDEALTKLQLEAGELVDKLLKLTSSKDEKIALGAINSALDRASKRTAPKTADTIHVTGLDEALEKIYGNQPDGR